MPVLYNKLPLWDSLRDYLGDSLWEFSKSKSKRDGRKTSRLEGGFSTACWFNAPMKKTTAHREDVTFYLAH